MSKEIKSASWSAYKEPIHYQQIEWGLGHLVGKVLTIIDASISTPEQNKAIKDLIRLSFGETFNEFQKQASGGKAGHSIKALMTP